MEAVLDAVFGVLGRLLMRETFPEDVQISTELGVAGYVTRVTLTAMGDLVFEGEECSTEEASQAAALRVCLEAFVSASDLARQGLKASVNAAPKPRKDTNVQIPRPFQDVEVIEDEEVQEPRAKRAKIEAAFPLGRLEMPRLEMPRAKVKAKPKPIVATTTVKDADGIEYTSTKSLLHAILSKMIGRSATKADIKYDVEQVQEGWQATITLAPPLGGQVIAGFPSSQKKDAELSAADVTIQWLEATWMGSSFMPQGWPGQKPPQKRPHVPIHVPPPASKVAKVKEVVRSTSLPNIQVPESLDFCLQWRDSRLERCSEADIQDPASMDYYFGQVCLVCQVIVSAKGWEAHANGKKHLTRLMAEPMKLRSEVERPLTMPPCDLMGAEHFLSHGSWNLQDDDGQFPAILTLGEMDFSFSLAVARLRPAGTPLVATSYLAEHDPNEPEVHPSDDGERAAYRRSSLPGMNGALQRNIDGLNKLDAQVLHSVDATDMEGTLRSQGVEGGFHIVIFPFPRYSLSRAPNPCNSRLLRDFFVSTLNGVLLEGGLIQVIMLSSQYDDWDVNGMANDVGIKLTSRVQLPAAFYQPREMSGKPWTPSGAELLTFESVQAASVP